MIDPRELPPGYLSELAKSDTPERRKHFEGSFAPEEPIQLVDAKSVHDMSRNELIREVKRLNEQLNRADLLGMVAKARGLAQQPGARPQSTLVHKEAFMLMRYVSEGRTDVRMIWNSRDGVTPFILHIDGLKYTHDISAMTGPFFDRPEGCVAQWETRTEMGMMAAWNRVLTRALLAGRMTKERAAELAGSPDAARGHNLQIGLRSLVTGQYTDASD